MRRFVWLGIALGVALGLALILGNRGKELSVNDSSNKIIVVTSIPLLKSLAEVVGGDEVSVSSVIKGANCSHEYEPSSGDMKHIAQGQIVIKAGMNFDSWFDELVESSSDRLTMIDASQGTSVLCDEEEDHAHDGATGGDHHHELGNPHYWGSPENVRQMAKNIMEGLSKLRPEKRKIFAANYQTFDRQLMRRAVELKAKVSQLQDKRIVSYSAAFPYFFAYFGFQNLETVETTCEQEVSPKHVLEVTQLINDKKIRVIVGEQVYPNLPAGLAQETGAKVVLLWPSTVDSGDYLKTMEENVERMVSALQ